MFISLVFDTKKESKTAIEDPNLKIKEILELNSKFFLVLDLEKLKDVIIPRDYAANVKLVAVKPGFSIHKQGETRIMHFTSFVDDELSPLEIHKGGFPSEEWIKDYILIEPDQQFLLVNITSKEYRGKIINQMIDSRHVAFDWDGEEMYDVRSYPSHDPKVKFIVCFDEEIRELLKNNK